MAEKKVILGDFIDARKERFKPTDPKIAGLQRIEKIDFSGKIFLSNKLSNTDMILVKKGDLVISGINVEKGAMNIFKGDDDVVATIHYSSYIFDENKIDIDFLQHFLKSSAFKKALKEQVPGGIKTEIKPKHILPLIVDIPTNIVEQRKIVKHLNSLNNKVKSITEELSSQLSLVKQLRQSFLSEAMQGKLCQAELIEEQENGQQLLARIKSEKAQLIKDKKLKKGKPTEQSLSLINDIDLPQNWTWCKADDIFFITKLAGFEYSEHIKLKPTGDIPVIRAQNVRPLNIQKTNLLYIDKEISELLSRCALTKRSLLVTFIGAGIGDVATFDEDTRWHLAPNVAKMEPFENCDSLVNVKFINYFLMSQLGQLEIFKHVKATAQPSLSMSTIRDMDLPIPPISIQNQIVSKLDELMIKFDDLETSIKQSQLQNEQLLQQVLKEALEVGETIQLP